MKQATLDIATSICLACNWVAWQATVVVFILYVWVEIIMAKLDLLIYGEYVFNLADIISSMAFFTLTVLCVFVCRAHWRDAQ